MYINKYSPVPAYFQLKNLIRGKIDSGEYAAGQLIPSERELSELLAISRMTVRQALNQLVQEGALTREKGRGTFVSKTKIEQRNVMSFSDLVRQRGMTPHTEVLLFETIVPDETVQQLLELAPDERVFHLRRLRMADDTPIGIEENFIPVRYCPGFEAMDHAKSLYSLMKTEFGYDLHHIDNVVEASLPTTEESRLLKSGPRVPLLRISGVNHTSAGLKLYHERAAYLSDQYKYSIRVFMDA